MRPSVCFQKVILLILIVSCQNLSNAQESSNDKLLKSFYLNGSKSSTTQDNNSDKQNIEGTPKVIFEGHGEINSNNKSASKNVSVSSVLENQEAIYLPTAISEGIGNLEYGKSNNKPVNNLISSKSANAITAAIYDAWWTDEYEEDGDGYFRSATLIWDADVVGSTGSLSVYVKLYYKLSNASTFTPVTTTAAYTITSNSSADSYHLNLHNVSHGLHDWRIDIYRAGEVSKDESYGPTEDSDLDGYPMENDIQDVLPEASISDAWWTDHEIIDEDGDGYAQKGRLYWNPDVTDQHSSLEVYEKIYWKLASSDVWNELYSIQAHTIYGFATTDIRAIEIGNTSFDHNKYDWRIDIFRVGEVSPDDSRGPSIDTDLNDFYMETAGQDVEPNAMIYNAWWVNVTDEDGDGYAQSARLNYEPDIADGYSTQSVYEKIYWKPSVNISWNLLTTTLEHTITGTENDILYVDLNAVFDHSLYDFRIDIFRSGQASPDDSYDPSIDADLDDFALEAEWQDVEPVPFLFNGYWINEVDMDGDGYVRSSELIWYAMVSDGYSTLDVLMKVSVKNSNDTQWLTLETTNFQLSSAGRMLEIHDLAHGHWDFKIEIGRVGQGFYDDTFDSSDNSDFDEYAMETPAEDVVGDATITGPGSMCPGASATFTASANLATAYFWEVPTGWVINRGHGSAAVNITSGSNSGNICVTPSNENGSGSLTCEPVILDKLPEATGMSGNAFVCSGTSESYTASATDADSYTWTAPADWIINSGQGSATITVTTGDLSGSLCATPSNSCGDGLATCQLVTVNSLPGTASIGGTVSACAGSTANYTASASDADSFNWTIPADWSIISGQGSASLSVTVGSTSGDICATPSNSCGEGSAACVTSTTFGIPGEATIAGEEIALPGSTQFFAASSEQANYYTWTVPAGWHIVSGQGTATLGVSIGVSSGDICVTPLNDCFTGLEACKFITTSDLPGNTSITGDSSLCKDASGIYIANASNSDAYTWTIPVNWAIISGQGTAMVEIQAGDEDGAICVTPSNSIGEGTEKCMEVSLRSVPEKPLGIEGETNPKVNESYTYSIDLIPNATSYLWTTTDGNPEGFTNQISFVWSTIGNQQITVIPENECGESGITVLDILVEESINGVNELSSGDLLLYPNPGSRIITIELKTIPLNDFTCSLTDITGKLVYLNTFELENPTAVFQLDISHLRNGVYTLSLKNPDWILTKKLIKE